MAKNIREFTPEEQIQRAFDREQIKNVFAKHCYCHLALRHDLEMETIWAHNAPNVSWGFPTGFQVGRDVVWDFYVRPNLAKVAPKSVCRMHTLTTPLIEIAGDGKTAQGMWYSLGQVTNAGIDGKATGMWMHERYAVDFIKEDGAWKIWHFFVGTDLGSEAGKPFTGAMGPMAGADPEQAKAMAEIMSALPKPTIGMELYHCKYGWHNEPHFPHPYATHTAEISYGPEKYL